MFQSTARFPDISHFSADVQFHDIKNAGCPLVITKCTEGAHYVDSTYQDFSQRIRSVGLLLGAFLYEDAAPEGPQVAHFFNTAHLQSGDIQPILDAEAAGLTKAETEGALEDLERRGYEPILYCNVSFYRDVLGSPTRWTLWIAGYNTALPTLPVGITLFAWQYSESGKCPGVSGPCDMNRLYIPLAQLHNFLIK